MGPNHFFWLSLAEYHFFGRSPMSLVSTFAVVCLECIICLADAYWHFACVFGFVTVCLTSNLRGDFCTLIEVCHHRR